MKWLEDTERFTEFLRQGLAWQYRVAQELVLQGLWVRVPKPMDIATTKKERREFAEHDVDIWVGRQEPLVLEVKSRNISFGDDPKSFPYTTAFTDTVSGWRSKTIKPYAYVMISTKTRSMVWTPGDDDSRWDQVVRRDKVRDITDRFYAVARDDLYPMSDLITQLQNLECDLARAA